MENLKVFIQKWVAILIILVLFLGQYAIIGYLATSYAIDLLATQSENVQFRAYFKNGEEELTEIQSSIDNKNLKLKIDVAVKNQGYFNGQISLANAGFKLDEATANNYINKIENNIIYLNQINAEETANLEVGIKYFEDEKIQATTLNQMTTVKLNGTYTGSSGNTTIDGGSDVKVIWNIPENTKAELTSKIQTNYIYKVNEENKQIVQFLTSSRLTNNSYPIKNTQITATIPTGAINVEVHKRTTKATNGEQEFTSANYNVENNILTINIDNTESDGIISWMKNVLDILVVTLEYPESTDLSTQNITVNEKITTQNNIELNAEQVQLSLAEVRYGIANISKLEDEKNIYKGKLYTQEGRDITSYSMVYVDYVDGLKEIEITEYGGIFRKNEESARDLLASALNTGNINLIKSIKINKDEVASVLGNTWTLTIGDTTITNETITNENEGIIVDENGNISLDLENGIKTLTIKTSKPVSNGSFTIETRKSIEKGEYTREQIKEFEKIADSSLIQYINYNDKLFKLTNTYNIGLIEPESKANLQSEQVALIAGTNNQALNLTAVLETRGEHQDLYKNPEIKIKLPSHIKNVTFVQKPQLIQANGLELTDDNYRVTEENGQKILNIKLTGEQTSYLGASIIGTTISIKTSVEINPNATNSEEEIVMTYTNENATKYTDNGVEKVNIQISQAQAQGEGSESEGQGENQGDNTGDGNQGENAGSGNQGDNSGNGSQNQNAELRYDVTRKVGGQEIAEGDTVKAGEIITYTAKITNSATVEKTGFKIESVIPQNTTLVKINPNYPRYDEENREYIDGEEYINKVPEITTLTQDNISIGAGKDVSYSFMVMANENITEEKNIQATCIFKENNEVKEQRVLANKIIPAKFEIICMPCYRRLNEDLHSGYSYIYGLKIKNLTNEQQNNVKVHLNNSEALEIKTIDWYVEGEEEYLEEGEDKEEKEAILENDTFTLDSISANKTAIVLINAETKAIKINDNALMLAQLQAQVLDSDNNIYNSNIVNEKIVGILATLESSSQVITKLTKTGYVQSGDKITYTFRIKNIGVHDAKNLMIKDIIPDILEIEAVKINGQDVEYTIEAQDLEYNMIETEKEVKAKEEIILEIKGVVKSGLPEDKENLQITNNIRIFGDGIILAENNLAVYNVQNYNEEDNIEEPDYSGDENLQEDEDYTEDSEYKYEDEENYENDEKEDDNNVLRNNSISGTAWLDTNTDGQRDSEEELLSNITVKLFDIENNIEINSTTTDENGHYSFEDIINGKYIVIFEYDNSKYSLTSYQVEGIATSINSDVELITMAIDGENRKVASTDTITINGNIISNIDIGLIEAKKFDLSLSKTISRVSVSNKQGNKTIDYMDTNLAKVEIRGKYLKGTVVMVEYKIQVTNNGELAGYAKKIVDNKPSDLKFNSKLNKDWYQSGNAIYTESLANEIIEPGETKEVTLILTKTMTESNTGLTNNKAKIAEYFNSSGIVDENSSQNDDISQADLIISVSTGAVIGYLAITIMISTAIAAILVMIIKKVIMEKTTIL